MNRLSRLEALERKQGYPIYVLAERQDGSEVECTARECLEKGYIFSRVICGGDPNGIDYILKTLENTALKE